ncbi:LmeA family phospholipid-binding protein [Amycolatopsis jejuensis]|uniref:LmeA family phospholipid-binding protein n=1 Tax=Amycolatopsis jejuensis TaxID=330084 RepID=UPI000AF497DC
MVSRPVTRDDRPAPRPDSGRRGKRVRRWLIVLGVLVILLVGADFGAAAFAEHTISQKARTQLGLSDDPSVSIHGFPFTVQALSGDYSHISVSADGVPVGSELRDLRVSAELEDVKAPLSDLTSGNTKAVKIGKLTGAVTIKASDLARVSPLNKIQNLKIDQSTQAYVKYGDTDEGKQPDPTPTNADGEPADSNTAGLRISGDVQVAGQKVEIFCFALIQLKDKTISIVPHRLQFGNDQSTTVVPEAVQKALLPNFRASVDTSRLPLSVTPTAVRVDNGSVTIKGEARDVNFSDLSTTKG